MEENDVLLISDETGFEINDKTTRRYYYRGITPKAVKSGRRGRANYIGAINYRTGQLHVKQIGRLNASVFITFLEHLLDFYGPNQHIYLIVDNAPGHTAKMVSTFVSSYSHRLTLFFLPKYSPDLNPIELLWRCTKQDLIYPQSFDRVSDLTRVVDNYFDSFTVPNPVLQSLCHGFF